MSATAWIQCSKCGRVALAAEFAVEGPVAWLLEHHRTEHMRYRLTAAGEAAI